MYFVDFDHFHESRELNEEAYPEHGDAQEKKAMIVKQPEEDVPIEADIEIH